MKYIYACLHEEKKNVGQQDLFETQYKQNY